jgi:serine/threonine protein kinase
MPDKIGPFQILGPLGQGAHSTILHIRRSSDSRQYALKVVPIESKEDEKFQEQAEHEYEVAQKLDHPNLIKVTTLEKQRKWVVGPVSKIHLLIEYVNGKTLDSFKVIPLPQLVQIFTQVADGMIHMHRRNIYHADLKPNNIMISKTGEVKIIDFGLAWIKGENKARVQGTPEYMAPEQVKNRMVNERTDLFNLGATMYRMVTWRNIPPIMSGGGPALDAKNWEKLLKPVKELNPLAPTPLADLIHRCIAYQANNRPESAREVKDILDQLVHKMVKSPDDALEALEWQAG